MSPAHEEFKPYGPDADFFANIRAKRGAQVKRQIIEIATAAGEYVESRIKVEAEASQATREQWREEFLEQVRTLGAEEMK